jgi:hypothetical protein
MMLVTIAKWVTPAMLMIVGTVHLLPLSGVTGGRRLAALYAITAADPNLEILLRHRAVLFGLLGTFLIYAAFRQSLQPIALAAGFVSVVAFLWLAYSVGDFNAQLARVVAADVLALVCLVAGSISYLLAKPGGP